MFTYEELKTRIDEIRNAELPEDSGALIIALQNDLSAYDDELAEAHARIDELERDVVARDGRIENLKRRNEELRYQLGEQISKPEVKEEIEEEKENIFETKDYKTLVDEI